MTQGPPIRAEYFASGFFIQKLMHGKMEKVSSEHMCFVDVRDVAYAHLQAIKVPEAANKRFILCKDSPSFHDYARPIVEKYGPLGWPVCNVMGDPIPNEYVSLFDNKASREILGVQYRDMKTTMIEMADRMVALGSVKNPPPTE